jgi:RimJ/RimL family protein N-acetyltransferase
MLTIEEAQELVDRHLGSSPRAEHSRLVADLMLGLAQIMGADATVWEVVGLCHDLDFEVTVNDPTQHGLVTGRWLDGKLPAEALLAIAAHDHRTGIICHEPLADMLKLADVLAVIDARLGRDWLGLLEDANAEAKLRERLPGRAYLVDMLLRLCENRALPLRWLTTIWPIVPRTQMTNITIRALEATDVEAYRELRLTALATSPEAFGSSYEEEARLSMDSIRARVVSDGPNMIFGALAGSQLVGMAGFAANERLKRRHKGTLWGVFLMPEWRGRGLGDRLVRRVIKHATAHVLILQAGVTMTNQRARQVYARLGFVPYGVERQALLVDGTFYDDELLALDLRRDPSAVA